MIKFEWKLFLVTILGTIIFPRLLEYIVNTKFLTSVLNLIESFNNATLVILYGVFMMVTTFVILYLVLFYTLVAFDKILCILVCGK